MKFSAAAEMPPIPDKNHVANVSSTTLKEWGDQLPIGILKDGTFHRNITFRPYTMKEERAMSKKRQKASKGASAANFVHTVLCHMITSVGPYDNFDKLTDNKKTLVLSQMYMADALYAYVLLRIQALGETFKLNITCPSCSTESSLGCSLEDLEVFIPEDVQALAKFYDLRNPIPIGKKKAKTVVLNPPRWSSMLQFKATKAPDVTDLKMRLIKGTVVAFDGNPAVNMSHLEGLSKYDFEMLSKAIDDHKCGTSLTLGYECPNCGFEDESNMQWDFDHFFGSSSL